VSSGRLIDAGADAIAAVGRIAAIDFGRLRQRLAALQRLDDEGIARLRQRPRAEIGGDQQGVAIQPFEAVLALGQDEAAIDEGLGGQVELAHDNGVLAAVGQADQAAGFIRGQAVGALPDPVLALGAR
jgi:hypothetical protein